MKDFEVLKDVYVNSGPPLVLLKGSKVRLCYAKGNPVLGAIFEDRNTQMPITRHNWNEYFRPI